MGAEAGAKAERKSSIVTFGTTLVVGFLVLLLQGGINPRAATGISLQTAGLVTVLSSWLKSRKQ